MKSHVCSVCLANAAVIDYSWSYPTFSGWTKPSVYQCGAAGLMRGDKAANSQIVLSARPAGTYTVSFDFYFINTWDGELGRFWWNNNLVWSRSRVYNAALGTCPSVSVILDVTHAGGSATLKFDSTLDEALADESWGVGNIRVSSNCMHCLFPNDRQI